VEREKKEKRNKKLENTERKVKKEKSIINISLRSAIRGAIL